METMDTKEIDTNKPIRASAKFCEAMKGKPGSMWHSELRHNAAYAAKITHLTLAEDRRRYIYLLQDMSRLMVSYTTVNGKPVVSAKIIM
jgi:hypothetical protein